MEKVRRWYVSQSYYSVSQRTLLKSGSKYYTEDNEKKSQVPNELVFEKFEDAKKKVLDILEVKKFDLERRILNISLKIEKFKMMIRKDAI